MQLIGKRLITGDRRTGELSIVSPELMSPELRKKYKRKRCGFRLIGWTGQGSIPWTCVGLIALLLAALRIVETALSGCFEKKEVTPMNKMTRLFQLFGFPISSTIWAIGASSVGGHLSA